MIIDVVEAKGQGLAVRELAGLLVVRSELVRVEGGDRRLAGSRKRITIRSRRSRGRGAPISVAPPCPDEPGPTRSKTANETMAMTMHSMNHGFWLSGVVAREARTPASVALTVLTPALHATTLAV
jgi:hypothetical protein